MKTRNTFTIHTELIDGTLSGVWNIYIGASSTCHIYVIPYNEIDIANSIADISGQPVPMDSPSGASGIILGRPSYGWDDWKDSDGNKLCKVVKRQ